MHFGCVDSVEDEMTVGYLRDTAMQAGLATVGIRMEEIGWDGRADAFVDLDGRAIHNLFKLYPWEGLYEDEFAPLLGRVPDMRFIEPAWKMLLSTKGILPILWELFPGHPNLLPASGANVSHSAISSRKPLHGREVKQRPGHRRSRNVSVETGGPYAHVRATSTKRTPTWANTTACAPSSVPGSSATSPQD